MKQLFSILLGLFITLLAPAQELPAYHIYKANGKKTSYEKMIKELEQKDLVFFGELHNNAIAHWLELEVTKSLGEKRNLILGAEMLEADNQNELNQYLDGSIDDKTLDSVARLWPNYDTDYAPLVKYAKENKRPFVATNIPRRYASMVYKGGFEALDSLSDEEKLWIATLPINFQPDLKTYQNILEMMGDHGSPQLVMAQAIKDATMAHFILNNLPSDHLFIHYNGAYHSDFFEGIVWHVKNKNSTLKISTLTTVSQKDIEKLEEEHKEKADFIICVDENMTNTY